MSDMEDLTKHQLILLTLLVSFITSIATGIITFTLLSEAPIEVTQTINRVVERTIEKVTPSEGGKTVVTEVQVVSEEDSVLKSIDKLSKSVVKIKTLGADASPIVIGTGVVVSDKGVVVMAGALYTENKSYDFVFSDGKTYSSANSIYDKATDLVFVKVGKPANEKYTFIPVNFGNSDGLKLGQTVIAVGGKDSSSISIGRVSETIKTPSGNVSMIISDISAAKSFSGSPIVNLSGEVVGLQAKKGEDSIYLGYTPINAINASLKTTIIDLLK